MNKIELLIAHEDGTWSTDLFDCPQELDKQDLNAVNSWIDKYVCNLPLAEGVVLFCIYNINPELDTDDPRFDLEEEEA